MALRDWDWKDIEAHLARGGTINGGQKTLPIILQEEKQQKKKKYNIGKREDLGGKFFRSSWEANVARYLNLLKSWGKIFDWEYEVDEFEFPVKRGRGKTYRPDFKVWLTKDTFEYWEVKGQMDSVSATKLKRMQKHYPQYRIILYDSRRYMSEIYPIRKMISGWESEEK